MGKGASGGRDRLELGLGFFGDLGCLPFGPSTDLLAAGLVGVRDWA